MIAIRRHRDWRTKLSALIEARRRTPHAYGEHDCGLFCADAIQAMTGIDLAAGFRGRYASAAQALALLQAQGYADSCAYLASVLAEIHPVRAGVGDVMAVPAPDTGWSLGICNGDRIHVMLVDGLGTAARRFATRAFRVPA